MIISINEKSLFVSNVKTSLKVKESKQKQLGNENTPDLVLLIVVLVKFYILI